MKIRKTAPFICAALIFSAVLYLLNPTLIVNSIRLKSSAIAVNSDETAVNAVVPFVWDCLYFFDPYTPKSEIEKAIGFKSRYIKETPSEGMMHIIFTKGNKIVCQVLAYPNKLGYGIYSDNFNGHGYAKIKSSDNPVFNIEYSCSIQKLTIKNPLKAL